MTFFDSKRPITKKLLQRIDLKALLERTDRYSLLSRVEANLGNLLTIVEWQEIVRSVSLEEILFKEVASNDSSPQMVLDL